MLTRDWIISYLSSLLNLRFVYTTLYITDTLHTYTFPEEERFTRSKYWSYQVLSTQYLLCCDPYLQFCFEIWYLEVFWGACFKYQVRLILLLKTCKISF